MTEKNTQSKTLAPKRTPRPKGIIKQDAVSQAEIIVLLDWLDKLIETTDWNGYVRGRLEVGYKAVETYFRETPTTK